MNLYTPAEVTQYYSEAGKKKAERPFGQLMVMSVVAGAIVALASAATNTLVYNNPDYSAIRLISGLLFPFALGIIILAGFELFTSNCLITIAILNKQTTLSGMFRNLCIVYTGNYIGSALVAASCAFFGQFNYSAGLLGAYTIKLAVAKCSMPFANALVMGILCNILVCAAALCSYTAKDVTGRVIGAYIPVALFVFAGFEHCIANMYYITAGLFAKLIPAYADMAVEMGIDMTNLTVGGLLLKNLLPVTLGNLISGCAVGVVAWYGNKQNKA